MNVVNIGRIVERLQSKGFDVVVVDLNTGDIVKSTFADHFKTVRFAKFAENFSSFSKVCVSESFDKEDTQLVRIVTSNNKIAIKLLDNYLITSIDLNKTEKTQSGVDQTFMELSGESVSNISERKQATDEEDDVEFFRVETNKEPTPAGDDEDDGRTFIVHTNREQNFLADDNSNSQVLDLIIPSTAPTETQEIASNHYVNEVEFDELNRDYEMVEAEAEDVVDAFPSQSFQTTQDAIQEPQTQFEFIIPPTAPQDVDQDENEMNEIHMNGILEKGNLEDIAQPILQPSREEVIMITSSTFALPSRTVTIDQDEHVEGDDDFSLEDLEMIRIGRFSNCVIDVPVKRLEEFCKNVKKCRNKRMNNKDCVDDMDDLDFQKELDRLNRPFEFTMDGELSSNINDFDCDASLSKPGPSRLLIKHNKNVRAEREKSDTSEKLILKLGKRKKGPISLKDKKTKKFVTSSVPSLNESGEDLVTPEAYDDINEDDDETNVTRDEVQSSDKEEEFLNTSKNQLINRELDVLAGKMPAFYCSSDDDDELFDDEQINKGRFKNKAAKTLTSLPKEPNLASNRKRRVRSSSEDEILLNDSPVSSDLSSASNDDEEVICLTRKEPTIKRTPRTRSQTNKTQQTPVLPKSKREKSQKTIKKRRKRIVVTSSDEGEGKNDALISVDDQSDTDSKEKLRFRKIKTRDKMIQSTQDAKRAEKERLKRLEEKQKEYNELEITATFEDLSGIRLEINDSSNRESILLAHKPFVLDLDKDSSEEDRCPVVVHKSLVPLLKPHQRDGIRFLYNTAIESLFRLNLGGCGGILAHSMGLGKTLQVITFLQTILTHTKIKAEINRAMVMAPRNVVLNWKDEFEKWLKKDNVDLGVLKIIELESTKDYRERLQLIKEWHDSYEKNSLPSVLILGYDLFQLLVVDNADKPAKKGEAKKQRKMTKNASILENLKPKFRRYLQGDEALKQGPHILICDEGHRLKSDKTILSNTMSKIITQRKIFLTGTPMQNRLEEYYCMVSFVKPRLLGTKTEFNNRFKNPIEKGKSKDANRSEIKVMMRRCYALGKELSGVLHRADYNTLAKGSLPPKREYVIYVRLTERQIKLIREYINRHCTGGPDTNKNNAKKLETHRIIHDEHVFNRICCHPYLMLEWEEKVEQKRFLNNDYETSITETDGSDSADDTNTDAADNNDEIESGPEPQTPSTANKHKGSGKKNDAFFNFVRWCKNEGLISADDEYDIELGNKLFILIQIIKMCERIGDKLLVFTKSIESLDFIEKMLRHLDQNNLWFVGDHTPDKTLMNSEFEPWHWQRNRDYYVISGETTSQHRRDFQIKFNDTEDLRGRLMLISTKSGSLGTNLIGANRVVIFDVNWNPSHDTQSLFRVYRFGQKKPVYVYRLIAQGAMEEIIYNRDVTKESIFHRVIDDRPIDNHFYRREIAEDITDFYNFEPDDNVEQAPFEEVNDNDESADGSQSERAVKDKLLSELLRNFNRYIVKYKKHDSLFDEFEEARLTKEDQENAIREVELGINEPLEELQKRKQAQQEASQQAMMSQQQQQLQMQNISQIQNSQHHLQNLLSHLATNFRARSPFNHVFPCSPVQLPIVTQAQFIQNLSAVRCVTPVNVQNQQQSSTQSPAPVPSTIATNTVNVQNQQPQSSSQSLASVPSTIATDTDQLFLQKLMKLPGMTNTAADKIIGIKSQLNLILNHLPEDYKGEEFSFSDVFNPLYESCLMSNDKVETILNKLYFVLKKTMECYEQSDNNEIDGFIQTLRSKYSSDFALIEDTQQILPENN